MTDIPLKHLATVRISNVDKKSVDGDVPVRLCNYRDVYHRDVISPEQDFMAATASPNQVAAFRLVPGDVIITKDSETPDDIGVPTYVVAAAPDLVCGYHLAVLRPDQRHLSGRYLYWCMSSVVGRDQLSIAATGVTRFGLRGDSIGGMRVPWWPLGQQRAIADYLDTETARIDALIAKKRRLADLLRERARTQITELFDQVQAEEVHLGRFVTSLAQGESPHSDGRPAEGEERGVLKLSSVKDGLFQPFENKALPDGVAVDALTPATGDLLVTRANTPEYVGDACVVEMDFPYLVIPDLIYRIRLSPELDPEYAALCLRQPRQRGLLSAAARGTSQSMVKLRGDDIRSIPIPFPDFGTQRLIATQARAMRQSEEQLCSRLTRQIALLAEHRQALITAAVTGELEIPGAA